MIKLTVKTLDSANHSFEVEAESTVQQFKEKIRDTLGLEIERQRLIFCGRVLQDDQKLNECGVDDGKCLHLVQRPPPSPPSRRYRRREQEGDNVGGDNAGRFQPSSPLRHHIRHLLSAPTDLVIEQQQAMSMSPTAGRMEFIRRMIIEIRESMALLRHHLGNLGGLGETPNPPTESMDTDFLDDDLTDDEGPDIDVDVDTDEPDEDEVEEEQQPDDARHRRAAARGMRHRYSRPRDLGQVLEDLEVLHEEFSPYRALYITMLRDLNVEQYPELERSQRQHTVTLICDIMHSFAHSYHAISDIHFHVGQRYPRLTSEPPTTTRHPLPVQAHINVVTTTGRRAMSSDGRGGGVAGRGATTAASAGRGGPPRGPAPPPAATAPTAAATAAATATATTVATATPAATAPIPSPMRPIIRPSTVGSTRQYQVAIETRGHIAIPIDNSLLSGLAAVASNLHQAQAQQDLVAAAQQAAPNAPAPASTEPSAPSLTSDPVPPLLLPTGRPPAPVSTRPPAPASARPSAPASDRPSAPVSARPSAPASARPSAPNGDLLNEYTNLSFLRSAAGGTSDGVANRGPSDGGASHVPSDGGTGHGPSDGGARRGPNDGGAVRGPSDGGAGRGPSDGGAGRGTSDGGAGRGRRTAMTFGMAHGLNLNMGPSMVHNLGPTMERIHRQGHIDGNLLAQSLGQLFSSQPSTSPGQAYRQIFAGGALNLGDDEPVGRAGQDGPHVLMDLDNLLRGLTGGAGVEVVMSMDDALGGGGFNPADHGNVDFDREVYVTPLLANSNMGEAQTTEILHNVIANVLRQNIGDALLLQDRNHTGAQGQTPGQNHPENQGQAQNQGPIPNPGHTQSQESSQNQENSQNQGQAQNQGQTQNQGPNQNQESNAEQRQHWQANRHIHHRRANDRAHSFAMACMVYDRYLACDSTHARRHLQERRENYQEQADEQERIRARLPPAPDIQVLLDRNPRFTPRHMGMMMTLLGGPVSEEGQLNAFLVTIARHLFLDPMNDSPATATPMPSEFPFIRMQLREYVQRMLERAVASSGRTFPSFEAVTERVIAQNLQFLRSIPREQVPHMVELAVLRDGYTGNAFYPVSDHLIELNADFLRNMGTITRINPDIDPTASVRVMTRSRLPAIIACMMSEASSDMFAARFYIVFTRFFTDMCMLFRGFCTEGFEGLLLVFNAFMAGITEQYEPHSRDWLRTVARENLMAIRNVLESNNNVSVRQYFRRLDGSMPLPTCCIYQALREQPQNVARIRSLVPHICERHQALIMPLQAPPLPAPPARQRPESPPWNQQSSSSSEEPTQESPPSGSQPPRSEPPPPPRSGESTTSTQSPTQPGTPEERSEAPITQHLPGWRGDDSLEDPYSMESELNSSNIPAGIISIGLESSSGSSLCDPEDDIFALRNRYTFMELNTSDEDRRRHRLEQAERENVEVDVVNDDGEPVNLPGRTTSDPYTVLSEAAGLQEQRTGRRYRRRNTDPNRDPREVVREFELNLERRHMDQSAREWKADEEKKQLRAALQRLAEIQAREEEEEAAALAEIQAQEDEEEARNEAARLQDCLIDEALQQETQAMLERHLTRREEFQAEQEQLRALEEGEASGFPIERLHLFDSGESAYSMSPMDRPCPAHEAALLEAEDSLLEGYDDYSAETRSQQSDETEFLTPITLNPSQAFNNSMADYVSNVHLPSEYECSPIPSDVFLLAENTEDTELSALPEPQSDNESDDMEDAGYLTPYSRMRVELGFNRPRRREAADSENAIPDQTFPEVPDGEFDDSCIGDPEHVMELALRHYARLRNNLTPPRESTPTEPLILTPEIVDLIERGHTRFVPPSLLRYYEAIRADEDNEYPPPRDMSTMANMEEVRRIIEENNADPNSLHVFYPPRPTNDDDDQAPGTTVYDHMDSEWAPVLTEDGVTQDMRSRAGTDQEPFSDAYLSGMPSRKRRCLREARPEATLDGLVSDGLRSVDGDTTVHRDELRLILRESVRSMVLQRSQQETDNFNPTQFQNTAAFLDENNKPKPTETEEKNPIPPPKNDTPPDSVE